MSLMWVGCLNHNLQHTPRVDFDSSTAVMSLWLPETKHIRVLHLYGHSPHIKHTRHLLYV
jgi:hypothetical protein